MNPTKNKPDSIIKHIYLMLLLIFVLILVIYILQGIFRSSEISLMQTQQNTMEQITSSSNNMLQILNNTQLLLLEKHDNHVLPLNNTLTPTDLINRVTNILVANLKIIETTISTMHNHELVFFLNRLQTELKLTQIKLDISKKIDAHQYHSDVYKLQVILEQFTNIHLSVHNSNIKNIQKIKQRHSQLLFALTLLPTSVVLYIIIRSLQSLKTSLNEKNIVDKKLATYHSELEDLISSRTAELQQSLETVKLENTSRITAESQFVKAKKKAELANQQKSDFLNRMSHELRTPMNAILGFSQLMEMDIKDEVHINYINEILIAGRHLQEMIDEVLDLSKIESGSINIKLVTVSLQEIVLESISLIAHQASDKNITITNNLSTEETDLILADPLRLKEVIVNILTNAVKYNCANGGISISHETRKNSIRLNINDTGSGIEQQHKHNIFEPFNRLGAEFTDIEGSGIGLSIAKKLIELMKGSIGFNSQMGKGTTFWIDLVRQKNKPQNPPIAKTLLDTQKLTQQRRIVYIEDNRANLQLIKNVLSKHANIQLFSIDNAEEGISLIRKQKPDLIILDINLPGMDGFQALRILQHDQVLKNIPVFALSASATAHDIERGKLAGFKHYLIKPIQIPEFLQAINSEFNSASVEPGLV